MTEETNPLEMSDEDIMNMAEPTEVVEAEEEPTEEIVEEEVQEPTAEAEETTEEETENVEAEESEDVEIEATDTDEQEQTKDTNATEPFAESPDEEKSENKLDKSIQDSKEDVDNTPNYEAEYKKLLSPFRASGKDVQINNVDEAIRLMQMGADYNQKMTGLKPNLKLLKMLENNELLDEGKLSYLIDLDKKNPEAITKLIKESGLDPLEVDVDAATEYQPNTYTVDDRQVELDGVLARIEHTDSYAKTIEIVGNKWDESSRNALYQSPNDIEAINDQIGSGIFNQIASVVQHQRMLGNLNGVSDYDAYKQVGTYMQQNQLFEGQKPVQQQQQPVQAPVSMPQTDTVNPKLKDRKKAASTTKTAPTKTSKQKYNPLSMSDEEFEKQSTPII